MEIHLISLCSLAKKKGTLPSETTTRAKSLARELLVTNLIFSIDDVLLVDGLKHNLLSISQLCDKGYIVRFESNMCIIKKPNNNLTMIALK